MATTKPTLAGGGYALGSAYGQIARWLDPATNAFIVLLALWYGWRLIRFRRRR